MSCSDKTPDLTVVFATHNGAATLRRTLDSFAGLTAPAGGWKLVVADNASSDETPQILEDYKARLPLSVLPVPARGKNRALNAAVALFEGPLIVFTDDDVVAEPDWLLRLAEAAAAHPDYDIFGGRIAPIWPVEPPAWLAQAVPLPILYAVIGETEAREGPINPGMIWGPNMAVRKAVFDAGHRFDDGVGPQAGQYRMGSETEFTTRLGKLGHRSWHCAAARVGHQIRPHQMDPGWIVRRAFRYGRDMFWKQNDPALMPDGVQAESAQAGQRLFGVPRWMVRDLVEKALQSLLARLRRDPAAALAASWERHYLEGYIREALSTEGRALLRRRRTEV